MFAIGQRIEIPVHYDLWMRGARFGLVVATRYNLKGDRYLKVKMDHPQVKRLVTIPQADWEYAKAI